MCWRTFIQQFNDCLSHKVFRKVGALAIPDFDLLGLANTCKLADKDGGETGQERWHAAISEVEFGAQYRMPIVVMTN